MTPEHVRIILDALEFKEYEFQNDPIKIFADNASRIEMDVLRSKWEMSHD